MTEAEMLENLISAYSMGFTALALYTTGLSGYLVIAYMVGEKITRNQMFTISILFVATAVFAIWGTVGFLIAGRILHEMQSTLPVFSTRVAPYQIIGFVQVLGIFASLKFMWDIRNPKRE